jgi:hypothetical protein
MATDRLTIVRKPHSEGYVNVYEVMETGETFSSLTADIASAFADYVKYRQCENDVFSWLENQSQTDHEFLEFNFPTLDEQIPEIKPPLSPRQDVLEKLLVKAFGDFLTSEIITLSREYCEGCKVDHPSQHRHDCMMADNKTLCYRYLTEALERVNDEEAMKKFLTYAANEQPPLNGLELLRYECRDSRSEIFSRRRNELEACVTELLESM